MKQSFKKLLSILMALTVMVSMSVPVMANDKVNEAKLGVFRVNTYAHAVRATDFEGKEILANEVLGAWTGSGFLINDTTLITNAHVADETMVLQGLMGSEYDPSIDDYYELNVTITIDGDVEVGAEVIQRSQEKDFAVLKLDQAIVGAKPLTLASESYLNEVKNIGQAPISVIGYPGRIGLLAEFSGEDPSISVHGSNISSFQQINVTGKNVELILHNADTSGGNSGGPVVTNDGVVVGVETYELKVDDNVGDSGAICISELTPALTKLGIEFNSSGGGASVTPDNSKEPDVEEPVEVNKSNLQSAIKDAKNVDAAAYTEESYVALSEALENAEDVNGKSDATQSEVDNAVGDIRAAKTGLAEAKSNMMLYIIIAAVVVVAVVVVLIVVMASKKKKKAAQPAAPATPVAPPVATPIPVARPIPTPQAAPPQGSADTTVLNTGSADTTVLRGQSFGVLTRIKTGEKISINTQKFIIGKEKAKVNYCIEGNTAISRSHAALIVKGSAIFIADLGTTNGTVVDGKRIPPNVEVSLKPGSKILIGEEDFIFSLK